MSISRRSLAAGGAFVGGAASLFVSVFVEWMVTGTQYEIDKQEKHCEILKKFVTDNRCPWIPDHVCGSFIGTGCKEGHAMWDQGAVKKVAEEYAWGNIGAHLRASVPIAAGVTLGVTLLGAVWGACSQSVNHSVDSSLESIKIVPKMPEPTLDYVPLVDLEQGNATHNVGTQSLDIEMGAITADEKEVNKNIKILTARGAGLGLWLEPKPEIQTIKNEREAKLSLI